MRSDKALRRWYNLINKKYFDSVLPSNVCTRWVSTEDREEERDCEQYYGWARRLYNERHEYEVVLSRTKNIGRTQVLATLVHEMCHVATETRDDHGPAFSHWHELLTSRGIFRKDALLKGLTIF